MVLLVSGSTGFVGKNLISYFKKSTFTIIPLTTYELSNSKFKKIDKCDAIIHLAGKAHDMKMVSEPEEYYRVNYELTKFFFDAFIMSNARMFIFISSVKATANSINCLLEESHVPNPETHYGKSKLMAEMYMQNSVLPYGKSFYILRPCMIHGPGNKGNLNLLFKLTSIAIPWPLGAFENKRSFCSIDNLIFIIKELIERADIPSGVYNVADDEALSTTDVISIMAKSQNRRPKIWNVSKGVIIFITKLGDVFRLPLTTERLQKLTESYVVSNQKIKSVIRKDLPISAKDGLLKTFNSFHKSAQ